MTPPAPPLRLIVAASVLFVFVLAGPGRAAESRVAFSSSLASVPVAVGARAGTCERRISRVDALSDTQLAASVEFSVALGMRDLAEFQARVGRGELVSYEEVQAKYLPLQSDYDRVVAWLTGQGFTLTFDDTSRLSVFARGTVAQVQSSFGVTMRSVTVNGVAYASATTAPSLPAGVTGGVLGINGLQPHIHKQPNHVPPAAGTATGGKRTDATLTPDSTANPNNPPYSISDVRNAYNGATLTTTANGTATTLTGSGQTIAIIIDALALHSDLAAFWANNKVAQSLNNVQEVNVTGLATNNREEEETLDEEWSSGIAPGATVRVYCSGSLDDNSTNLCLAQIQKDVTGSSAKAIAQPNLHALSMSYGQDQNAVSASEYSTESGYYATIANGNTFYGGVSIFASSGDSGSQPDEPTSAALIVSYPAADASITGVGGTDLYYSATAVNGRNWTEKGWGEVVNYSDGTTGFGGSGGGAATTQIARPVWQVGTGVASGTTRLVPDVSAVAASATYADLEYNGVDTGIAGTSWSSPTWAGFSALINQARTIQGLLPLGSLNRRVYPLIGTANFYDVTTGNNSFTSSTTNGAMGTGSYAATTGYDEITGIGTPNLTALAGTLSGPTITSFTPASGAAGTSVTITGTNFYTNSTANPVTVSFNGTAASSVTVNSATQITAAAPSGVTTGPIVVTVTGDAGVSSTNFTVGGTTPKPVFTSFTPRSVTAGTSVIITGTNLTGTTAVGFNGTAASYMVNSAAQISAIVPSGTTAGTISLTTGGGTATSTSAFTLVPTFTGFTPNSGDVGASVVITGTNLTSTGAVSFNGTAATSYTINSDTQITATVPVGAATGPITVTTAGGTVLSSGTFTVTPGTPAITHVVISQVYGGSSSGGTSYTNDYIELFNPTNSAISLASYSIQYGGGTDTAPTTGHTMGGTIPARGYFLIAENAGGGSLTLPTPNVTSSIDLGASAGFVILSSQNQYLVPTTDGSVVDLVGYGSAVTYRGSGPAPAPSTTTADLRGNGGYTDTDNNVVDFTASAPNPHNSSTTVAPDLTITCAHSGNFTQADTGDTYTIIVTNSGTAATTGATVSVVDTLPNGLTPTAISGTGWTTTLGTLTAIRDDVLPAGGSYPAVTVTVNVSSTAASSVTNSVTVSGGGESNTANDITSDATTINALTPSQSWRYQYFGTTADSGNAADTANPAGDGLNNLLKYALGLDPTRPEVNPETQDTSTGYLRLTVPKNSNATDITYSAQVTGDLTNPASWSSNANDVMIDQNTTTIFQAHDRTPVSGTAKRFIRLQVSR